jgi:hypothetical protein
MANEEDSKQNEQKGAKPHRSWLFFSKNIASNSSNLALTLLAIAMVAVIVAIMVLASLGLLPNIGGSSSSLSSPTTVK